MTHGEMVMKVFRSNEKLIEDQEACNHTLQYNDSEYIPSKTTVLV